MGRVSNWTLDCFTSSLLPYFDVWVVRVLPLLLNLQDMIKSRSEAAPHVTVSATCSPGMENDIFQSVDSIRRSLKTHNSHRLWQHRGRTEITCWCRQTPWPFPSLNHTAVRVFKCLLRLSKNVHTWKWPLFWIVPEEGNEFGSWELDQIIHTMFKHISPKRRHRFPFHSWLEKAGCVGDTPPGDGGGNKWKHHSTFLDKVTNLIEGLGQIHWEHSTGSRKKGGMAAGGERARRFHRGGDSGARLWRVIAFGGWGRRGLGWRGGPWNSKWSHLAGWDTGVYPVRRQEK